VDIVLRDGKGEGGERWGGERGKLWMGAKVLVILLPRAVTVLNAARRKSYIPYRQIKGIKRFN